MNRYGCKNCGRKDATNCVLNAAVGTTIHEMGKRTRAIVATGT